MSSISVFKKLYSIISGVPGITPLGGAYFASSVFGSSFIGSMIEGIFRTCTSPLNEVTDINIKSTENLASAGNSK